MNVTLEELLDALDPQERADVDQMARDFIAEEEARQKLQMARDLSRAAIARRLHIPHHQVADIEEASAIFLAAFRNAIEAMGGSLSLTATFPGLPPVEIPGSEDNPTGT